MNHDDVIGVSRKKKLDEAAWRDARCKAITQVVFQERKSFSGSWDDT